MNGKRGRLTTPPPSVEEMEQESRRWEQSLAAMARAQEGGPGADADPGQRPRLNLLRALLEEIRAILAQAKTRGSFALDREAIRAQPPLPPAPYLRSS